MKTKQYTLTRIEVMVLAEALDALWFGREKGSKDLYPESHIFNELKKHTRPLLEQMKNDVSLWRN